MLRHFRRAQASDDLFEIDRASAEGLDKALDRDRDIGVERGVAMGLNGVSVSEKSRERVILVKIPAPSPAQSALTSARRLRDSFLPFSGWFGIVQEISLARPTRKFVIKIPMIDCKINHVF